MDSETSLVMFGDFLGFDDIDLDSGTSLHWESESSTRIVSVSASSKHISIVLDNFLSFSVGFNMYGQLGIGSMEFTTQFTRVVSEAQFAYVTCGDTNTFWVGKDKRIYVAGDGFGAAPVAFGDFMVDKINASQQTLAGIVANETLLFWPDFSRCREPIVRKMHSRIAEISCGSGFVVFIANDMAFKLTGGGDVESLLPVGKYSDSGRRIVKVNASNDYALVLDDAGDAWLFGQIGNMTRRITTTPIAREIRSIFAMPNHCAFVNCLGVSYTFGHNESGQLADGTKINRARIVEAGVTNPTIEVVGGETFTVFLSVKFDGSLFEVNMEELIPGHMLCPFEKADDIVESTTTI